MSKPFVRGQTRLSLPAARDSLVREPTIVNGEQGVRLLVREDGPVNDPVMVSGQVPCKAGRSKRRNSACLGLLPPPESGVSDITEIYGAGVT